MIQLFYSGICSCCLSLMENNSRKPSSCNDWIIFYTSDSHFSVTIFKFPDLLHHVASSFLNGPCHKETTPLSMLDPPLVTDWMHRILTPNTGSSICSKSISVAPHNRIKTCFSQFICCVRHTCWKKHKACNVVLLSIFSLMRSQASISE